MGEWLSDQNVYYILMLVIYSGLGSWLIGRLTRSRADSLAAARLAMKEGLELLDRLDTARKQIADPEKRRDLDVMYQRLLDETQRRAEELNGLSEATAANPSAQYVVLPTPRSLWAVLVSLVFAASLYFAIFSLLTLGFEAANDPTFDMASRATQERALTLAGLGVALGGLAFIARWLAYRAYDARHQRLREKGKATAQAAQPM